MVMFLLAFSLSMTLSADFYLVILFSTLLLFQSSPSVYSQWSTEPCRADCAAGEAQIVAPATPANQPPSWSSTTPEPTAARERPTTNVWRSWWPDNS